MPQDPWIMNKRLLSAVSAMFFCYFRLDFREVYVAQSNIETAAGFCIFPRTNYTFIRKPDSAIC